MAYKKGRIKEINAGGRTNDVGKIRIFFGKDIYFRAPRNKYKLNDMVHFEILPNGEAKIIDRVEENGLFRRKKRY
ncbi:hypothetical protein KY340_00675 [Candidatus Woesearchaeota archaeon]|nr:hypothetical protein [Candidatus Woesearchaeota archaeon]